MNDSTLSQKVEGLLFAVGKPLSYKDLEKIFDVDGDTLQSAVQHLRAQEGRGVVVVDDGRTIELRVAPEAAALVEQVRRDENAQGIGRAGLEVLAAVLYRGPLTRAEIDFIRGVNSTQTLRTLHVRGLVRRVPNPKDERSFLYEATTELLAEIGTTHARDLPNFDAIRQKLHELEVAYHAQQTD